MDFQLDDEQEAFRAVVRSFADAEVAPHAEAWDRDHTFPLDAVRAMGELGLFGLVFPEAYGGSDAPFSTLCIAIEEIGRADQSLGITLSAGVGLGANPIFSFGTEEQRQRWLPDLVAGRALGAFGLTEPDGGSDAGATRTKAALDEAAGEWVIEGSKAFITNSGTPITSLVTVTARTGQGEISAIVVPAGTPGLVVEPAVPQAGLARLRHPRARARRLPGARPTTSSGRRAAGSGTSSTILDDGRVAISALAIGAAQACLDHCARLRQDAQRLRRPDRALPGGRRSPSPTWPSPSRTPACSPTRRRGSRSRAARSRSAAAMAKLYATEAAVDAARTATQVFGGYGFMEESPVARIYRDVKVLEIGEGTSEIQRLVIARSLGLPVSTA